MVNKYYQKTRKSFKPLKKKKKKGIKRIGTDIKIFLKKKKRKSVSIIGHRNKNLSEEEKQKKNGYLGNYYLAHKK